MVNKVTLIGYLGKDPEVIYTSSGKTLAKFSIATSEQHKEKNGTTKQVTHWHRIQLWDNLANIAQRYLKKGAMIYLEGKLTYNSYVNKKGETCWTTDIIGFSLQMMSKNYGEPDIKNDEDKDDSGQTNENPPF